MCSCDSVFFGGILCLFFFFALSLVFSFRHININSVTLLKLLISHYKHVFLFQCYIEPSKGYKFFSKPEVLRYLETVEDSSGTSKKGKKCSKINTPNDKSCTSKEKKSSKMQTPNNKSCSSKKEKKCASVEFPNDNSCTPKEEEKGNNMDFPNNNSCAPKKEKNGSNLDSPNGNSCTSKKEKIGTNMDSPKDSSCTPKKEKNYNNTNSPIDVCITFYLNPFCLLLMNYECYIED